jgi:hypothetical protein
MAKATTVRGKHGYIQFETAPNVFTKLCGFSKIEYTFEKDMSDVVVPDCDDLDAPSWVERDVVSLSASFSCAGVASKESIGYIEAATLSSDSINARVRIIGFGEGSSTPDKLIAGKFHIKHKVDLPNGERIQISVDGESDGVVAITDVAAA